MPRKSQVADNNSDNISVENNAGNIVSAKTNVGGGVGMGKSDASQMDILLDLISALQKQVQSLVDNKTQQGVPVKVDPAEIEIEEDEFDKIEIRPDTYIRVISICPFPLNLSTLGGGKGKVFSFQSFGQTKRIMYSDLLQIIENHQNFLSKGYFYIMNKAVIRKNGLDEYYANILTKDHIEMILAGNNNDITISLFKSANKEQKALIVQMLVDKMIAGHEVDLNLIDKLSRDSGIDISAKYEDTKAYVDLMEIDKKK